MQVIIGGQALSHCVNYTTRDLLRYWTPRDPADLVLLIDGELQLSCDETSCCCYCSSCNVCVFVLMVLLSIFLGCCIRLYRF